MKGNTGGSTVGHRRWRRWPFGVAAAVLVIIAVVVTLALSVPNRRDGNLQSRPAWTPPPQSLLAPMRTRPALGWTLSTADLGLPGGSRITTADDPVWSRPFVGYLDTKGYFLATNGSSSGQRWWLVGIDVAVGRKLFDPVPLGVGPTVPRCFLNGPGTVVCVRESDDDGTVNGATAWVVNSRTGAVTFTGATDLRTSPGGLDVEQVGIFAVAESIDRGVYGVGAKAETTWFVPGRGSVGKRAVANTDVEPLMLATQEAAGDRTEIFSVVDGSVVTPAVSAGRHSFSAAVYPGGFAVEVAASESDSMPTGVEFFDPSGNRVGAAPGSAFLSPGPADLPIVQSAPRSVVFGSGGQKLADISAFGPGDMAILAGSRLLVEGASADSPAEQYDLRTGVRGKDCDAFLDGYLGTDGTVGVFASDSPNVGLVMTGIDLATCDSLWQIRSPAGSLRTVWRSNTTLVQLSDDGTQLSSLVSP